MDNQDQQQDLNIELTEDVAAGVFSNLVLINHSPTEFVLDFIQMLPGMPKAKVKSRIILTPEHAKRLSTVLNENIERFEQEFGELKKETYHLNFGPKGQA